MLKRHLLPLAVILCLPAAAFAQDGAHVAIDAAARTAVIASLAEQLKANYVFPDIATQVAGAVVAKDRSGGYAKAVDADAFSEALSKDLRTLGKDGHFRVDFAPGAQLQPQTLGYVPPKAELDAMRQEMAGLGYGLQRVERLRGNVGYIEVRGFGPTQIVADALSAAMTLVSGTDALILDLRRNGGGEPSSVAYLLSHFFAEGDQRHLNDIYTRPIDATQQFWTQPAVAIHYDKPVYVLTSARTFSGGEECAYDLQTQKRATLVGETTGGGANPGDEFPLGHDLVAFIPTGRSINPVTHTNWEHVGVKPDIATPAADAQKTAYAAILRTLLGQAKDPDQRKDLQEALHNVEAGVADVPNYAARQ